MAGGFPRWVVSCFRSQRTAALPQYSLDAYTKLWAFYDCLQSLCVWTTSKPRSVSDKASVRSQVSKRTSINTYWFTVRALWESRSDKVPSLSGTSKCPSRWQLSHTCGGGVLCHQVHCSGSEDSPKDALSLPCLLSPDLTTPETDLLVALLLCTLRVHSIVGSHLVLSSHPLILPHDVLCYYIKK